MIEVVTADDSIRWREALSSFDRVDVCHMPEYHLAYDTRFEGAKAFLWTYSRGNSRLSFPFLLSPIIISEADGKSVDTGYFDISGVYGFSGPLSNTSDRGFLDEAWQAFDDWAKSKRAISEFIRFSVYSKNFQLAHLECRVEPNRPISVSILPENKEAYIEQLPSKTRNMIRRASREGLVARKVPIRDGLDAFRELYERTMARNQATSFFAYDDRYYNKLLSLPAGEIVLHAVYSGDQMVAAAIGLVHKTYGFYHLGASDTATSKIGAGNLVLYDMACRLIDKGVKFFNVGGGRTTSHDDPLFRFKESNGTSVEQFYIGKRVLDSRAYQDVAQQWQKLTGTEPNLNVLQFYRR